MSLTRTRIFALSACLVCLSCEEVRVIENPVLIAWPVDILSGFCVQSLDADDPSNGVDVFIIDVIAYNGPVDSTPGRTASVCRNCSLNPADSQCEILSRTCMCSGTRTNIAGVMEALSGIRIADVPSNQPICLRIITLAAETAPGGSTSGPAYECGADVPECLFDSGVEVAKRARLCTLSDLIQLGGGENTIVIRDVRCSSLDDLLNFCLELTGFDIEVCVSQFLGIVFSNEEVDNLMEFSAEQCAGPMDH